MLLEQQCHLVTPFQLFFTYRAAFENGQVRVSAELARQDPPNPGVREATSPADALKRRVGPCRQVWRLLTNFL